MQGKRERGGEQKKEENPREGEKKEEYQEGRGVSRRQKVKLRDK